MAKQQEMTAMEEITLHNDIGSEIVFTGRLYAEHSFYDEDTGSLTQQRLYLTKDGCQVYAVVTGSGQTRERRAYVIKRDGRLCKINNGLFDVTVSTDDLITVVKGLCGITGSSQYEDFFTKVKDTERAVNE
ncbi:MAG: hypothetical protein D6E12_08455 [Desulfovibrio sp.]|nr:MAG: hypothetical protein D6E12_08455 [Desulfovibrio sp.]